ncbi:helix-turn-helix domain-containing protein [Furfurilactobacillus sp. WILCCON 0119]
MEHDKNKFKQLKYLGAREAADIWGKNSSYVQTSIKQSPKKWPKGSYRRFDNRQIVVTAEGMEAATGEPDPHKED